MFLMGVLRGRESRERGARGYGTERWRARGRIRSSELKGWIYGQNRGIDPEGDQCFFFLPFFLQKLHAFKAKSGCSEGVYRADTPSVLALCVCVCLFTCKVLLEEGGERVEKVVRIHEGVSEDFTHTSFLFPAMLPTG